MAEKGKFKLADRHYLEGKQFDWALVIETDAQNNKGETVVSERRLYFPKLTQVAAHLVAENAKLAGSTKDLVDTITKSTQEITERLMGVEERLTRAGSDATIESVTEGEGNGNGSEKEKPAAKSTTRRRTRKKKTAG